MKVSDPLELELPTDVGGPSVYVLLLLVNEQRTALSLWQGQNRTRRRKLGCMLGERRVESERSHAALPETDAVNFSR